MTLVPCTGLGAIPEEVPGKLDRLAGKFKIVQANCGQYHTALLSEDGRVFTWGFPGFFIFYFFLAAFKNAAKFLNFKPLSNV